jgi:hypothetical protein
MNSEKKVQAAATARAALAVKYAGPRLSAKLQALCKRENEIAFRLATYDPKTYMTIYDCRMPYYLRRGQTVLPLPTKAKEAAKCVS